MYDYNCINFFNFTNRDFYFFQNPRYNRLGFLIEDYLFLSDVTDLTINTKKIDAQITPTIAADIA